MEGEGHALPDVLAVVLRDEPEHFPSTVRALLNEPHPPTRDDLMVALLELRASVRSVEDEMRENLVLDMLDWVVGWCSPGSRPPFS